MNQSLTDLSPRQLRQAADLKERIESLQHDLAQTLGSVAQPADRAPVQKKHKMSAAARARIAAGARARWARIKGTTSVKPATQPKRKSVTDKTLILKTDQRNLHTPSGQRKILTEIAFEKDSFVSREMGTTLH